jgi:hypothetical protein
MNDCCVADNLESLGAANTHWSIIPGRLLHAVFVEWWQMGEDRSTHRNLSKNLSVYQKPHKNMQDSNSVSSN